MLADTQSCGAKWLKAARKLAAQNAKEIKKNRLKLQLAAGCWLLAAIRGLLGLNLNPS